MAQILVTIEPKPNWYQNIASVKNYFEGNVEDKILKHGQDIFSSFYVLKCKYEIVDKTDRSRKFEPDFILVSKNFKSWTIVEIELCYKKDLTHTKKQLNCFLNPEFDPDGLAAYLIKNNPELNDHKDQLTNMLSNRAPNVLAIFDDYCEKNFNKLKTEFPDIKICVVETYRNSGHPSEAYRISGDYPYEVSGISQLRLFDAQHYEVLRPELLKDIKEDTDFEVNYYMRILRARIFRNKGTVYLKIPENPLPPDINVELNIDLSNSIIIKKL